MPLVVSKKLRTAESKATTRRGTTRYLVASWPPKRRRWTFKSFRRRRGKPACNRTSSYSATPCVDSSRTPTSRNGDQCKERTWQSPEARMQQDFIVVRNVVRPVSTSRARYVWNLHRTEVLRCSMSVPGNTKSILCASKRPAAEPFNQGRNAYSRLWLTFCGGFAPLFQT
ncbi:hypothetical protein K491DRAFT_219209 [Lophiostoma macrostomum CBS 122681]|uniref:Uncharacterized protein n=1 Tax=Lophiostoma macrostomum CBS 122681 TaxID=1314788 RepID=A0A6A6SRR5_9PLEO|nr:hypothetical protein K491DRAFT_219209 [Lophiostoma macrostomum CBS 122681]